MIPVIVSLRAEQDLADIIDYISRDNPIRALSFADELEAYFLKIGERPNSFSPRPEWGAEKRSAVYGRYVIIFKTNDDHIEILRVAHGARDLDDMF
jgi:toxin ParE1/3/4